MKWINPGFPRFASDDKVIDLKWSRINKGFHVYQTKKNPFYWTLAWKKELAHGAGTVM